jgi:hypothetical protein
MTPLITIQILGLVYKIKQSRVASDEITEAVAEDTDAETEIITLDIEESDDDIIDL